MRNRRLILIVENVTVHLAFVPLFALHSLHRWPRTEIGQICIFRCHSHSLPNTSSFFIASHFGDFTFSLPVHTLISKLHLDGIPCARDLAANTMRFIASRLIRSMKRKLQFCFPIWLNVKMIKAKLDCPTPRAQMIQWTLLRIRK